MQQVQKVRKDVARGLILEGWIQEGLEFVEKAKANMQGNLEDLFLYEMQILNYDKVIK